MPTVDVGGNRPLFHHTFCSFRGGTGYHSTLHSCNASRRSLTPAGRIAWVRTFLSLSSLLNCFLLAVFPGRLSSNMEPLCGPAHPGSGSFYLAPAPAVHLRNSSTRHVFASFSTESRQS
jgi:hypothetical protein